VSPTALVNIVLTAPLLATLIGLLVARKLVFGWVLDEAKATYESRSAEMKAGHAREIEEIRRSYERELAARDVVITHVRADYAEISHELRETGPTLVRANDGLRATQDLLREVLRRGSG
jgi:hypothetical protein